MHGEYVQCQAGNFWKSIVLISDDDDNYTNINNNYSNAIMNNNNVSALWLDPKLISFLCFNEQLTGNDNRYRLFLWLSTCSDTSGYPEAYASQTALKSGSSTALVISFKMLFNPTVWSATLSTIFRNSVKAVWKCQSNDLLGSRLHRSGTWSSSHGQICMCSLNGTLIICALVYNPRADVLWNRTMSLSK